MEIARAVSSINRGMAKSNRVISQRYFEFVKIILAVALLVRLTHHLYTTLKAEYRVFTSGFKISYIAVIYMFPPLIN